MQIIVKNNSDQSFMIDDLGIEIPSYSSIDITELFDIFKILISGNLKKYVENKNLIINDGINDLNSEDGVLYITM